MRFEEAWGGMPRDGRSPGLWGAGRVLRAGCGRGICEHASLSCAGEVEGGGGSAVGKARRRFQDRGRHSPRRCTGAFVRLGHPHVHQLEPRRRCGGHECRLGKVDDPRHDDREATGARAVIGPSSETRPKIHRTSSELQLPTGLLFIVLACTRRACRALDGARALRRIVRDARPSAFPHPRRDRGVRRARRGALRAGGGSPGVIQPTLPPGTAGTTGPTP